MADKVTDFAEYRIRQIEIAESKYYKTLIDTLDRIEKRVVNLVASDLEDLEKVAQLRVAIRMRPKIKAILEQEYLKWSDTVVREGFNKQAKRVERAFKAIGNIPKKFQQLTEADLGLIKNLKNQTFSQFKDVSNTFTRRLSEKVYQSVLAGVDFAELEQELRQSINGIYASSKDTEVNKLVAKIKRDEVKVRSIDKRTSTGRAVRQRLDKNIQILQTKFARDRAGENMKRFAGQVLNDSLREFDSQLNLAKSEDAGLTHVKYQGSLIPTTREFCKLLKSGKLDKRRSGVFTIDEVKQLWRSRSWKGKKAGNPLIVRGGYNCRHQWSFVSPTWYDQSGKLIIN
tara:strand:+ start:166 stop:1191 length:1026 start_codon:yes stop_codon:yes gene_type:complete